MNRVGAAVLDLSRPPGPRATLCTSSAQCSRRNDKPGWSLLTHAQLMNIPTLLRKNPSLGGLTTDEYDCTPSGRGLD